MEIQELKAMAYDLIAQREAIGQRLQQVNQAIAQEQAKPEKVKPEEKPVKVVKKTE